MEKATLVLAGLLALLLTLGCEPERVVPTPTASATPTAPVVEARASPSAVPSPAVTRTLTPTFTPTLPPTATPTRSPTPTPYVVAEYPEQHADGSVWWVRQWSDDQYTATLFATRTPTPEPSPPLASFTQRWSAETVLTVNESVPELYWPIPYVGVFHNLAFGGESVGKRLTVRLSQVDTGGGTSVYSSGQPLLYRSYRGRVQAGDSLSTRSRAESCPPEPPYPTDDACRVTASLFPWVWRVEEGQYFLLFAGGSTGGSRSRTFPYETITYTIEVVSLEATPTPYPTPNPSHPPATGTFVGNWDGYAAGRGHEIVVSFRELASGGYKSWGTHGPFLNLALTEQQAGKLLTVQSVEVACQPGVSVCRVPRLYLLRSWVGEIRPTQTLYIFAGGEPQPYYHGEIVALDAVDSFTARHLQWRIDAGQYVLYWGADFYSSANPGWTAPPLSVTYTVSIE